VPFKKTIERRTSAAIATAQIPLKHPVYIPKDLVTFMYYSLPLLRGAAYPKLHTPLRNQSHYKHINTAGAFEKRMLESGFIANKNPQIDTRNV
jgi:hypothetical protein